MTLAKIKRIRFAHVSGFLVYNSNAAILIDAGHSGTTTRFTEAIREIGKSPGDVTLIVLTHTHFDHAGGAKKIKELCGALLAVHRTEAGCLSKGMTPFPRGTRWKGKVIRLFGKLFLWRMAAYPPAEADLLIDDEFDLAPYGIPGKVVHTPGHTSGSLSVLLETGEAIVGDNVLGINMKEHFPPFANDMAGVLQSWELYIRSGVQTLLPAHGGRVKIECLVNEMDHAKRKYC
ncbi:MAG: MBL fold metallo-hydrolase [Bacteroidales bacterium]